MPVLDDSNSTLLPDGGRLYPKSRRGEDEANARIIASRAAEAANEAPTELEVTNAQLEVARNTLKEISEWSQQLQDDVILHGTAVGMWRGQIARAKQALKDMRNIKHRITTI